MNKQAVKQSNASDGSVAIVAAWLLANLAVIAVWAIAGWICR